MLYGYPDVAAAVYRPARPAGRHRAGLSARTGTDKISSIPVHRIVVEAYVLPGCSTVYRRLQYRAVVADTAIPPGFHFEIRIGHAAEVKARAYYLRLLEV